MTESVAVEVDAGQEREWFQPEWLTEEVLGAFEAVPDSYRRKRWDTIVNLAEAIAQDRSMKQVFRRPDCCGRDTWYGYWEPDWRAPNRKKRRLGWREDPTMMAALDAAVAAANRWYDMDAARRVQERMHRVSEAKDLLCEYAPMAAMKLALLILQGSEASALKSAIEILDRADRELSSQGEGDWRKTARDEGIDPDEIVSQLASVLQGRDEPDSGGSDGEGKEGEREGEQPIPEVPENL